MARQIRTLIMDSVIGAGNEEASEANNDATATLDAPASDKGSKTRKKVAANE